MTKAKCVFGTLEWTGHPSVVDKGPRLFLEVITVFLTACHITTAFLLTGDGACLPLSLRSPNIKMIPAFLLSSRPIFDHINVFVLKCKLPCFSALAWLQDPPASSIPLGNTTLPPGGLSFFLRAHCLGT